MVYPFPQSMLYYIWDFNRLEDVDEKFYIKQIITNKNNHQEKYLKLFEKNSSKLQPQVFDEE